MALQLMERKTALSLELQNAENESERCSLQEESEEIDSVLTKLNVRSLDQNTVKGIFGDKQAQIEAAAAPTPGIPEDTDTVDWRGYTYYQNYKGKQYQLFNIHASPTETNGKLFNNVIGGSLVVQKTFKDQFIDFYEGKAVNAFAEMIISLIDKNTGKQLSRIASWIPWDLLNFQESDIELSKASEASFSYLRCNTNMVYTFVYNDRVDDWDFVVTTHYTTVASSTSFYLTGEGGRFYTEHLDKQLYIHSDHYDDARYAIDIMESRYYPTNVPVWFHSTGITQNLSGRGVYLSIPFFPEPLDLTL